MTKLPIAVKASSAVGSPTTPGCFGVYQGSVVSTADPLNQGRVTLLVPQVLGTATSNWALPLGSSSLFSAVTKGQMVHVSFQGGNRNLPVYAPLNWVAAGGGALSGTTLTLSGLATFNGNPPMKVTSGAALNDILVSDASGNM